jgi:formylglycine-generating enzyme required for sulfatase activity
VGTYPQGASPWSLQDLAGNAWEWQANEYQSGENNPALRGGAWFDGEDYLRVSNRSRDNPSVRINNIGFRCARSLWS